MLGSKRSNLVLMGEPGKERVRYRKLHRLMKTTAARLVDRIISFDGAWWCADRVEKLKTIAGSQILLALSCPGGILQRRMIEFTVLTWLSVPEHGNTV